MSEALDIAEQILRERIAASRAVASSRFDLSRDLFGKQLAFAQDEATFVTASCSRRAGKSRGAAGRLLKTATLKPQAPILYFTLTRKDAKRIMWEPLLELNRRYDLGFVPIESDLVFKRNGLARIYLTGCDNQTEIGKMRGSGWGDVVGDEAQLFPSYIKPLVEDVLTPSLMDYMGSLRLIGTPAPVPVGYFYEAIRSAHWSHHAWTAFDNPHVNAKAMLDKALALRGVTVEDPSIQREFFGKWVYDPNALVFRYDPTKNNYTELPTGDWETVIGVDLGFDDADAIAVLGFCESRAEAHLREEWSGNKQTITQLAARLAALIDKYKPISVVMDTGGLGKKIAEEIAGRYALPIKAAEKKDKFTHIELLNDAMRSGKFFAKSDGQFARDCLLVEWDREKSTNDKLLVSDRYHSDICDAVLYAYRESLHWLHEPPKPRPNMGTPEWYAAEEKKIWEEDRMRMQQTIEERQQEKWEEEAFG